MNSQRPKGFDEHLEAYNRHLSLLEIDPSLGNIQMAVFASASLKFETGFTAGYSGSLSYWRRFRLYKANTKARKIADRLLDNDIDGAEDFAESSEKHWDEAIKPAIRCAENDIIYYPGINIDGAIKRRVA